MSMSDEMESIDVGERKQELEMRSSFSVQEKALAGLVSKEIPARSLPRGSLSSLHLDFTPLPSPDHLYLNPSSSSDFSQRTTMWTIVVSASVLSMRLR
jgi:hypothetical protein